MKFAFENFVVDADLAEISRSGTPIPVEPRVFDLLIFLIENRERVVPKDDIVEAVWSGRFISDASISSTVKSLRHALDDDGETQRVIKTQRGRGFRFMPELTVIDAPDPAPATVAGVPPEADFGRDQSLAQVGGRPSIAVLQFQTSEPTGNNLILSEAIPHELIQALSKLRWLRVIARASTFKFSLPELDLGNLGQVLGVRYALQGSVNQLGEALIVTVELSDCLTRDVVWADRFETRAEHLQELRSKIVVEVVAALEIFIPANEADKATVASPENLDAWANYHLGLRHMYKFTKDNNELALAYFNKAVALEPTFARAHAGKSFARFQDAFVRYTPDRKGAIEDARRHAERSVELDPLDPFSNLNMGRSYWLEQDPDAGLSWLERSVSLSPNFAQGYYSCAFTQTMIGDSKPALENSDTARLLSPIDPFLYGMHGVRAMTHTRDGNFEEAARESEIAAKSPGAHYLILMIAVMAHSANGNQDRVSYWRDLVKAKRPDASVDQFLNAFPYRGEEFRQRVTGYLEDAGF